MKVKLFRHLDQNEKCRQFYVFMSPPAEVKCFVESDGESVNQPEGSKFLITNFLHHFYHVVKGVHACLMTSKAGVNNGKMKETREEKFYKLHFKGPQAKDKIMIPTNLMVVSSQIEDLKANDIRQRKISVTSNVWTRQERKIGLIFKDRTTIRSYLYVCSFRGDDLLKFNI